MAEFFFMSYSSVDGKDFAIKLADVLASGPPTIPVWLDKRSLRPGEDWDEQVVEAIKTCKGMVFIMSADSVRPDSVCKNEWVRALRYKKPVIPILLDRDAELPFRLGSREYINFSGSFDSAVARLRRHLAWMDSPEGQMQALKYRLSDAQRELPRAAPENQARIQEDIAELKRQITQQQRVIDNPKAAEQRVQQSIEAGLEGERQPAKPVCGITQGKFVNPPPLIAPTWFQDRYIETRQVGDFLKDESLRLMTVVGRGGVGKSAMVCRLLRSLEGGQLPDDGGALKVDGIVYLSAARTFHRVNLPDLFASLTKLLPEETVRQLDAVYKSPQVTASAIMETLARVFPSGRTVVLLDNFEDVLSIDTGQIKDAELNEALRALLELPPHGIKVIITTRVAPGELALVQPSLQRRLDLDTGLEHPYAENILRSMDADGKVGLRDAPEALLAEARERTLGYPRALEHLFGILSADRDTSLREVLDDTRMFLPDQVVVVLVGEAFSRLDLTAQRVMQALAIYHYPVPSAAVDYLLQPHVPGIDGGRVLSRLVNMQFARRDAGRYYLHQVDRDYSLSRMAEGDPSDRDAPAPPWTRFALQLRAADWFRLSRKPRESWQTLSDLAAQLAEFELRCECEDYDTAAALVVEFDSSCLFLWGHYRLMSELHQRLLGNIADSELAAANVGSLGSAIYRMGEVHTAITHYEQGLELARQLKNRWNEAVFLGNLAACVADVGQMGRALEYCEQALAIRREVGDRKGESQDLGNLGNFHARLGQVNLAIKYGEQALAIDREIEDQESESIDLNNLGYRYMDLGRTDKALIYASAALAIARRISYRMLEGSAYDLLGSLHMYHEDWEAAVPELERAIEIADEIGYALLSSRARRKLALVNIYRNNLSVARDVAEEALQYDDPSPSSWTREILGVVALHQGDLKTAKEWFTDAIDKANERIALTADEYAALDVKGLSLLGLTLSGDAVQITAAKAAFSAARAVTSHAGITLAVLQRFDALAQVDTDGILAEVRPVAAGENPD